MLVLVIGIGITLIYFIQSSKVFDYIFIGKFLSELRSCPKCLGVYIFTGLQFLFHTTVFDKIIYSDSLFVNILLIIISSIILSLGSFYLVEGWQKNHTIHYIK